MNHTYNCVRISHYDTYLTYDLRLLPQLVAGFATYTTHNKHNKHTCLHRHSNPQYQESSGRRTTPQTARPSNLISHRDILQPTGHVMHQPVLTFNNCTLCPHCVYVFCVYLRTNSDLCHLQHKLIGFYDRDEKCLQRGTDWVFK